MEMQELEIIIPPDGTVTVRVKGISGTGCLSATKGLEGVTGTVIQRDFSAAYYEKEPLAQEHLFSSRMRREE